MNEHDGPTEVSKPTEIPDGTNRFGIPLSRRQIVLVIGVSIIVAIILWRRRVNSSSRDLEDSESPRNQGESEPVAIDDEDGPIYVPQDPDDELEKDAAVIDALRDRGKLRRE